MNHKDFTYISGQVELAQNLSKPGKNYEKTEITLYRSFLCNAIVSLISNIQILRNLLFWHVRINQCAKSNRSWKLLFVNWCPTLTWSGCHFNSLRVLNSFRGTIRFVLFSNDVHTLSIFSSVAADRLFPMFFCFCSDSYQSCNLLQLCVGLISLYGDSRLNLDPNCLWAVKRFWFQDFSTIKSCSLVVNWDIFYVALIDS